ncbi:hypothetical protein [Treponema sp.]|uniref:hypothetical protein n=1 Tax=Treponema sp. TaxID=166 RepID=UPI003F02089E
MKNIKPKTFVILMGTAFIAAFFLLLGCIIFAQKSWGIKWQTGITTQCNQLIGRQQKTNYISQENIKHTGYIIGGSKAGALRAEKFNAFTNGSYYNFYVSSGNFRDFSLYIEYILKEKSGTVKDIVLHLSSHESEEFIRVPFIPVQMQDNVFSKLHSTGQFTPENYLNVQTFFQLYKYKNNTPESVIGISAVTGERSKADDAYTLYTYEKVDKKFYQDVFCYWEDYDSAIKDLFYSTPTLPACEKNIQALKQIKSACEENGVKLTVVIGPTFIAECYKYATPQYIEYIKEIVSVCGEVWNFSGINNVNLNPYNFYNGGHCWIFAGDKMIETMFSPNPNKSDLDAFGILLTSENTEAFINRQKEKWQILKEEYDRTGKITLQTKDDESYLGESRK